MTQLTPLQLTLLTGASQRADGHLLPPPETLNVAPNRVRKAAGQLVELGLATEGHVADQAAAWRLADGAMFGAIIADAGREQVAGRQPANDLALPSPAKQRKRDLVLALLTRPGGASVDEIMAATGWLAHTTRAVLTGLRNKGHTVEKTGERGASRYHVAEEA